MIPVSLIIAITIVALAAAKTVLFIKNIADKKLLYWFFFPKYKVIPSSRVSRKCKELQNRLSAILLIMLIVELGVWAISRIFL